MAEETLRRALAHNLGIAVTEARQGLAELEVSLGNGAIACELIEAIPLALARLAATPDFVEASLLTGNREAARAAVDALTAYTEQAKDPYFLALLTRCRAQLELDSTRADALYREALAIHAQSSPPFDRARTELVYGELLRRGGRRTEAARTCAMHSRLSKDWKLLSGPAARARSSRQPGSPHGCAIPRRLTR